MDVADAAACQNMELFEAGPDQIADFDAAGMGESQVHVGQVGIRCIHCSPPTVYTTLYPDSLDSLPNAIRMLSDRHLSRCTFVHPEVRQLAEKAANIRLRKQDGDDRQSVEDGTKDTTMNEYCAHLARSAGLSDRQPPKSGVSFRIPNVAIEDPVRQGHGPGPDSYRHMHGTPGGQYPMAGPPAQPLGTAHESIAATPLARRSKTEHERGYPPPHPQGPPLYGYPHGAERDGYPAFQHQQGGMYNAGSPPHDSHPQHQELAGAVAGPGAHTPTVGAAVEQPHEQKPIQEHGRVHESPHTTAPAAVGYNHHSPYEPPQSNFPYYQDTNGSWVCRYCATIPPQYREHGAIWSPPDHSPPPTHIIDQHLSLCSSYNQAIPPAPGYHYPGYANGASPPHPHPSHYEYPPYHFGHYNSQPMYYHPHHGSGHLPGWNPDDVSHHVPGTTHPDFAYPPQAQDPAYSYPPHLHEQQHGMAHGPPATAAATAAALQRPQETNGDLHQNQHQHLSSPPGRIAASTLPPSTIADTTDITIKESIATLSAAHKQYTSVRPPTADQDQLVLDEDKALLTDYFFHLIRQLKLCRFSEADRKTRGGKRENIAVGYGGLQCIHCSEAPTARKFFWSNVDRLANSFAEIPGHILKCRRCPNELKSALAELKRKHPEQMARLARGSQKVFFRRMWRRLHPEDSVGKGPTKSLATPKKSSTSSPSTPQRTTPQTSSTSRGDGNTRDNGFRGTKIPVDSPGTSGDENAIVVERSSLEAAKALAASSGISTPPSPSSRVRLAIPEDKEWLSDMDCFIRGNLEVFCATEDDVEVAQQDRKYPVLIGQVGIRCIHCALTNNGTGARGPAVSFPYSINGIYESVREFQRLHLDSCTNLPKGVKSRLLGFRGCSSLSSVLRKYYILAARGLGMHDTPEGIRSGAEPIAVGPSAAAAFATADSGPVGLPSVVYPDDETNNTIGGDKKRPRMDQSSLTEPSPKRSK